MNNELNPESNYGAHTDREVKDRMQQLIDKDNGSNPGILDRIGGFFRKSTRGKYQQIERLPLHSKINNR